MTGLLLLACVVAGCVAAFIFFVLYGPIPVRRSVVIAPRIAAADTTIPITRYFTAQPVFTPVQPYTPVDQSTPVHAIEPPPVVAPTAKPPKPAAKPAKLVEKPPFVAPPAKKPPPPPKHAFTPVVRRRAGLEPLPPSRAARGTAPPRIELDDAHTLERSFEDARTNKSPIVDNSRTDQVQLFDSDELTHVDDVS